jgi:cytidine deaminase
MTRQLSPDEHLLIDYAKDAVVRHNTMRHAAGDIDTLYAFLLSESGANYDGAAFEANLSHASICAERFAIADMVLHESYAGKIKAIVVADPVPVEQERSTPPCGTCRHLIWHHGRPDTAVILMQYIQTKAGWTFPRVDVYTAEDFYPFPYEPNEGKWDGWEPK